MDRMARKLAKRYSLAPETAVALVDAGFPTPGTIRRAKVEDLQKVAGIGKATADRLQGKR